jgi:hypothetical protein
MTVSGPVVSTMYITPSAIIGLATTVADEASV